MQQKRAQPAFKKKQVKKVKVRNKKFIYEIFLEWQGQKKGLLLSRTNKDIKVATPPEFGGHAGIWSPEELFIASVNSCIMTTFLHYARRKSFEFLSYKSKATGILKMVENQLVFSKIKIKPQILVKHSADIPKANKLIELSEKNCLISNSIKSKIEVTPEIKKEL